MSWLMVYPVTTPDASGPMADERTGDAWVKCLNRRKGVVVSDAQFIPR